MHYNLVYSVGHFNSVNKKPIEKYNSLLAATTRSLKIDAPVIICDQPITVEFSNLEELIGDIMRNHCNYYEVTHVFGDLGEMHETSVLGNAAYFDVCAWLITHLSDFSFFMYTFRRGEPGIYQLEKTDGDYSFIKITERRI